MKIICFYEPILVNNNVTEFSRDSLELIKLWEKSWSKNGWNPVVLSLQDAKKHPKYYEIDLKNYSSNLYKNSINGNSYLELCYSRWFAYGCHDGAWSDYDVINYGFRPEEIEDFILQKPIFIDNIGSCGFSTSAGHEKIIEVFIEAYKNDEVVNNIFNFQEQFGQTKDISDMHVISDIRRRENSPISFLDIPLCTENFSNDKWRESKLVHYHNGLWDYFDNNKYKTRSNFIKTERPI